MTTATSKTRKAKTLTEEEYLDLPGGQLVEFDHGRIEVLAMPDEIHQCVVFNLQTALHKYVRGKKLGRVLAAPLPVKVANRKFREPDVVFLHTKDRKTPPEASKFWENVSLVIEVLSSGEKNRRRDLVLKRAEYAAAGIPEYWIVDPKQEQITTLKLRRGNYVESGVYGRGELARSMVLAPFAVSVDEILETEE